MPVPKYGTDVPRGTRWASLHTPPTATFARAKVVELLGGRAQVPVGTGEENLEDFGAGGVRHDTFVRIFVDVHETCVERQAHRGNRERHFNAKEMRRSGGCGDEVGRRSELMFVEVRME